MELESLLYVGALLACPIGMGAMMWMMGKNMGGQKNQSMSDAQVTAGSSEERLAVLRAQRQVLEAEITEATRLAELEARAEKLHKDNAGIVSQGQKAIAMDGQA